MKPPCDGNTGGHQALDLGHPLDDALANWIEKHADYLASAKCLWWVKFHAADMAGVLLPEAAAYDPDHASYLEARLRAMRHDKTLLKQGMGDLAKRLTKAYRIKGKWTEEEARDAKVVGNLIERLGDYGVLDENADQELDEGIYEDLARVEPEKLIGK